ncbi:MAG: pantetheine-phosphate adenylyltransferase [Alphaproteobacteria bacterium]
MTGRQIGVYPGTFDPITHGHLDIIRRARRLVGHLIIGVAVNAGKEPLLSLDERVQIVREEVAPLESDGNGDIEVRPFDNLLMQFAAEVGAGIVVRGLRAVSDFEYEFQMTGMNARLNPGIETVFLMATETHQFIASRLVKEVARLGGDISSFVSPSVCRHLAQALARERRTNARS